MEDATRFLKDMSISMAGHFFTTGPGEELEKYLAKRVDSLTFISYPFSFSRLNKASIRDYLRGSLVSERQFGPARSSSNLTFARDMISTVLHSLRSGKKYDIFIGIGGLNAYSGLILRKLGFTKSVIFYVIDYVPKRFENRLLNKFYHWIDKECATKCDFVWNLAKEMEYERQKRGIISTAPQLVVPIGTNFSSIKRSSFSQINRFSIAYLGILLQNMGVQLIIESFAELQKDYPNAKLIIIGRGEYSENLKELVRSLGMSSKVNFTGEIKDHSDVEEVLATCGIGIAPYVSSSDSYKFYTDPGKVKTYMACGLPVILTDVPKIAREIRAREAGIVIEYSKDSLVKAVSKLFNDELLHKRMRENAITFASEFEWTEIFNEAFNHVLSGNDELTKHPD